MNYRNRLKSTKYAKELIRAEDTPVHVIVAPAVSKFKLPTLATTSPYCIT